MSKREVELVIICEDSQHEAFARRFFERRGYRKQKIRIERNPFPRGAADNWVKERYAIELAGKRKRHVASKLVVLIDGDRYNIKGRKQLLANHLKSKNIPDLEDEEAVAIFVPTWNIESWIAYLSGQYNIIDEGKKDYPRLERESKCLEQVKRLIKYCDEGSLRKPAPSALESACEEYKTRLKMDER